MFLKKTGVNKWELHLTSHELDLQTRPLDSELDDSEYNEMETLQNDIIQARVIATNIFKISGKPQVEDPDKDLIIEERECVECANPFNITKGMKAYFDDMKWCLPTRCKPCRVYRKLNKLNNLNNQ